VFRVRIMYLMTEIVLGLELWLGLRLGLKFRVMVIRVRSVLGSSIEVRCPRC